MNAYLTFIETLSKLKFIHRTVFINEHRQENDVEHSWHLAMIAWMCALEQGGMNTERVIKMAPIHDLPEIFAGDTYFCDSSGNSTRLEREQLAREKILSLLPEKIHEEFISIWEEFEACETRESRLVNQCDKLAPVIEIFLSGKESYKIMKTTKQMTLENKLPHFTDEFGLKKILLDYIERLDSENLFPLESN